MTNSIEKEILFDVLNNPNDTFYENVLSDFLDEQGIEHDFRKPLHNNKITKLKPYQEKCLYIWANHWINIGLCTRPTDKVKVEQYVCDLYKQLDLEKPKNIIWFNNPIEMCDQIKNHVNDLVLNRTCNEVKNKIKYQAWHQVSSQINNQLFNRLLSQIWNQVLNQVNSRAWNQVWNKAWNLSINQTINQITYRVWWQQNAHWLALYSYCMQVLRIESPKQILLFILLAQEVNWWFPTEKTVFVTKKPKECIIEDGKFIKLIFQDNYIIT
jgi:hypothetical protein